MQVGEGAIYPGIELAVRCMYGARVGFAIPDLVQGLCARLVELEPARSSHSDKLTTRRNVQSGNLTRLERQLENRAAGRDVAAGENSKRVRRSMSSRPR